MRFRLQETKGGLTVFDSEAGECFKSRHNASKEVEAVFFRPGVEESSWWGRAEPFRVLELGFGLGTNFSYLRGKALELTSIDRDLAGARFFLEQEENAPLEALLGAREYREGDFFARLLEEDFFKALPRLALEGEKFHCVYFDPFSPKANPEAWGTELFRLAANLLLPEGRLVTYSVSRAAKDGARAAGLTVEKRELPSDLQKRESLVCVRKSL